MIVKCLLPIKFSCYFTGKRVLFAIKKYELSFGASEINSPVHHSVNTGGLCYFITYPHTKPDRLKLIKQKLGNISVSELMRKWCGPYFSLFSLGDMIPFMIISCSKNNIIKVR